MGGNYIVKYALSILFGVLEGIFESFWNLRKWLTFSLSAPPDTGGAKDTSTSIAPVFIFGILKYRGAFVALDSSVAPVNFCARPLFGFHLIFL